MCGIAGFIDSSSKDHRAIMVEMTNRIVHRGPDASGVWHDDSNGIHLGFRRLAIIDLTKAGNQPMHSASGRYVIIFNGEIYNHIQIREELEKNGQVINFNGRSDTETLLAGIEFWGLKRVLQKCVGMFAIAVWDRQHQKLFLARDRLGEKPLYYGWCGKAFVFASEIHCFKGHPEFNAEINVATLGLLLKQNYIRSPYSIYQNIFKLSAASILEISLQNQKPKISSYWSLEACAKVGIESSIDLSDKEAVDTLHQVLSTAIGRQMVADVPLGAFLSGGIDSSIIVALMQEQSKQAIKTFSIGFNEQAYNEAVYAKAVAERLGTEHTEVYVTAEHARSIIPKLADFYSEPFADSSQIPTVLVSQIAQKHVTVSLSGDGGDELFYGYERYQIASRIWNILSRVPYSVRHALFSALKLFPSSALDLASKAVGVLKSAKGNRILTSARMDLAINLLETEHIQQFYELGNSHCVKAGKYLLNHNQDNSIKSIERDIGHLSNEQTFMLLDALEYLPDDLLVKVDRAAMSTSLETRVPFLDHQVVELAWRFPSQMKYRDGKSKWILRELLSRYLPNEMINRPKMGFSIPIGSWLTGTLQDWAHDLLDPVKINQQGYFKSTEVTRIWQRHQADNHEKTYLLWNILMFQAWLEKQ